MICYMDRTWCASPNCQNKCGRKMTDEDHERALAWWGGADYPVSMSYFCGGEDVLDELVAESERLGFYKSVVTTTKEVELAAAVGDRKDYA